MLLPELLMKGALLYGVDEAEKADKRKKAAVCGRLEGLPPCAADCAGCLPGPAEPARLILAPTIGPAFCATGACMACACAVSTF